MSAKSVRIAGVMLTLTSCLRRSPSKQAMPRKSMEVVLLDLQARLFELQLSGAIEQDVTGMWVAR